MHAFGGLLEFLSSVNKSQEWAVISHWLIIQMSSNELLLMHWALWATPQNCTLLLICQRSNIMLPCSLWEVPGVMGLKITLSLKIFLSSPFMGLPMWIPEPQLPSSTISGINEERKGEIFFMSVRIRDWVDGAIKSTRTISTGAFLYAEAASDYLNLKKKLTWPQLFMTWYSVNAQ